MYQPVIKKQWIQDSILNSFSGMYLTMLSIMQGVAMSLLAGKVPVTKTAWQSISAHGIEYLMMCLLTLIIIIVLWHSYFWLAVIASWTPLIWDSLFMFSIGAIELIAIKSIGSTGWFYAIGLLGIVGGHQYKYNVKRLPMESWSAKPNDNAEDIGQWIRDYKTRRGENLLKLSEVLFLVTALFDICSLLKFPFFTWILLAAILAGQIWAIAKHISDQKETLNRI